MEIEEIGYWEGQNFVFYEPREINGHVAKKIVLPEDVWLPPGVSRNDVIHAMLNQVDPRDEGNRLRSVVLRPGQANQEER